MATRTETLDGRSLGMRFAAQGGARMHLNTQELELLFSLDEDTQLTSDNAFQGTAGEWLDAWTQSTKADMTDMRRWGRKSLGESLAMRSETKLFLGKDGLEEKTAFKR